MWPSANQQALDIMISDTSVPYGIQIDVFLFYLIYQDTTLIDAF